MREYSFERLEVWKTSKSLAKRVYLSTQNFPSDERYGLTSQVRRAAVSISTNLAEGSSRSTGKEQARFTEIAYGSLMEVLNLLMLATEFGFLGEEQMQEYRTLIEEIGNKLNKLRLVQLERS